MPNEIFCPHCSQPINPNAITPKEYEVIKHLIAGLLLKEVALEMGVSRFTIIAHLKHLRLKLEARTNEQLIAKYIRGNHDSVSNGSGE